VLGLAGHADRPIRQIGQGNPMYPDTPWRTD
jgi:hypothetical protein